VLVDFTLSFPVSFTPMSFGNLSSQGISSFLCPFKLGYQQRLPNPKGEEDGSFDDEDYILFMGYANEELCLMWILGRSPRSRVDSFTCINGAFRHFQTSSKNKLIPTKCINSFTIH